MTAKIRNAVRAIAVAGVVAAGTFAISAPAQATLFSCQADVLGDRQGVANCLQVTSPSHFRVKVECVKYTNGATRFIFGPWRYSATPSSASCLTGEYANAAYVDSV